MLESDAVLERALSLKAAGKSFAVATVVRSESPTSAKPGAKALVEEDGTIHGWIGGGCAQPAVIATARKVLEDGQARLIRISPHKGEGTEEGVVDFGMTCHSGGTLDIFIDPVVARPALLVIGASPAAQALAALATRVGFTVTAAFPGADRMLFPDADRVADNLDLEGLPGPSPAFVVVATQGKRDEAGLEAALSTGAGHVAFIASRRKAEKLREYLKERGYPAERVDAIESPAGIDIGALTEEEIAVSVLASAIRARRKTGVGVGVAASAPAPASTGPAAGEARDPVCGMTVDVATSEFYWDYLGTRYYFCCEGCRHAFQEEPERYLESALQL